MSFGIVTCVCGGATTTGVAHEHHVVPQAAGGRDGPTVWLCANCHNIVHRIAEAIAHNRAAAMLDQLRIIYPSGNVQYELQRLAQTVAAEMEQARLGKKPMDSTDDVPVTFRISRGLHALVTREISSLRDQKTGRKVGVPGFVKELLMAHLREKGLVHG